MSKIADDFSTRQPGMIAAAGMAGAMAGSMYDAGIDNELSGILDDFESDPDGMAGEISGLYEVGAKLAPFISPSNANKLVNAGEIARALIGEAAKRQSEWGQNPNYPTTATLTAAAAGTVDSDTITLRPLGSGTSDEGRPLTLLSFLGFSTKANETCECRVTDILVNGAPTLATVGGVTAGGGFFFERIRPVNLQGPHIRPVYVYGLNFKVGDTYAIRATCSAAGVYFFELDFAVRPFQGQAQRAPSMFSGGTGVSLARAIGQSAQRRAGAGSLMSRFPNIMSQGR